MSTTQTADALPTIPRKRRGLRFLIAMGCLLGLLWAAPRLACHTPVVAWACAQASQYFDGSVSAGSVSLGWFAPVVIQNFEVRDPENRPVLQIQKIESERTLLSLLINGGNPGSIRIEKPRIEWTFRGDDSNLERMLVKWLPLSGTAESAGQGTGPVSMPFHVEISDGTLMVFDDDTSRSWQVNGLAMSIAGQDGDNAVQMTLQGALNDGVQPGTVKADIQVQNSAAGPKATVKGRFSGLPLALGDMLARRVQPGASLAGSLQGHCNLVATLKDGKPSLDLSGELTASNVRANSQFLAEPLSLDRCAAPCRLRFEDRRLIVEQMALECDLGKATLQGSLDCSKELLAALDQPDVDLALQLNLSILTSRLPKTLHVHPDLRLTAGQVDIKCKSHAGKDATVWEGSVHSTDVRGIKGDRTIVWPEPLQLAFQAHNLSNGVPLIDDLQCTSRFLNMQGATTPEQFTLKAEVDLQQLAEPLADFVDLGALKLEGKASGTVTARRTDKEQFVLEGNGLLKQMKLSGFAKDAWQEETMSANFSAEGSVHGAGKQRLDRAAIEVKIGNDVVQLQSAAPIADLSADWGTMAVHFEGDLARWQKRARGLTKMLDDWQLGGSTSIVMQFHPSAHTLELTSVNVQTRDFRCAGGPLRIQEPTLSVQTSARWDGVKGRCVLGPTKIICPTVTIDAENLSLSPATGTVHGSLQLTGDVGRLRQWTQNAPANPATPMAGALTGRVELEALPGRCNADFNLAIRNFSYGAPANPAWNEPVTTCTGRVSCDFAQDAFEVEKINVVTSMLNLNAVGKIAHLASSQDVDFSGILAYDLEKMEPQLRPILGKDVKIAGRDARPFKVGGALNPGGIAKNAAMTMAEPPLTEPGTHLAALKGETSCNWKSLNAMGCDVGPAQVKAILQRGWFQVYPIETTFNGGKLKLQPNVRIEPEPMEMILLAGPMIERAKITPEMCAGAMAYAMPLLANVARAEGLISLKLDGGRIPLGAPRTAEIKGTIILHSAKLEGGPITGELSGVLKMPPPTGIVKECAVPFHLINGQVHHRDMELAFPDFTVKSSGMVGLDGTLAIVLEMPIPPKIAAAAHLTPAQAKQIIRIPINGTIDHPRADARALEALTSTLGRSVLENQLNRLLQGNR